MRLVPRPYGGPSSVSTAQAVEVRLVVGPVKSRCAPNGRWPSGERSVRATWSQVVAHGREEGLGPGFQSLGSTTLGQERTVVAMRGPVCPMHGPPITKGRQVCPVS